VQSRSHLKSKIISLFIFVVILWTSLLFRAAYLQFLPHEKLKQLQERQFQTIITLPSRRGNIIDTYGRDLAMASPAYSVYADPKIIENRKSTSKLLASYLPENATQISLKLKDKSKRFVWLSRLVNSDIINRIKEHKIKGIGFVEEWKRIYPNDYMLSTTLGFVGKEGQGLEGIELYLDKELRGEAKKLSLMKDAKGRPLVQDGMVFKETPQGKEVKLTIDSDLQYFVETELMQSIKKHEADGAYAVILDAKTSAIRSLVSLPYYNLNSPYQFSSQSRRNKSVTDTFEPGSTLKTFILAEALQTNTYQPDSLIFCENGQFKIGKRTIREAEKSHSQGTITVTEVLKYSSNIGTSKIALKLGSEAVSKSLSRFGFGRRMNIDLPGEAKGIVINQPWGDHLLANISFGQGITSTPLQMANAYASIANGGYLNTPYIIEDIKDLEAPNEKSTFIPKQFRESKKILSDKVAQQMKDMLVEVTADKGTGVAAQVPGFIIGGKTGTAQKINPYGKGYLKNGYIASFAGYIPAQDPKYVIYIAVDHPRKNGYYGSQVAAPLFSSIASYAMRKNGIRPTELIKTDVLADQKFDKKSESTMDKKPEKLALENKSLRMYKFEDLNSLSSMVTSAPDLSQMSLREALEKTSEQDIRLKIIGSSGVIEKTEPASGEALNSDRQMTIYFKE
jgi:cell division protein FtsI (penicillin-binding protein 3)